MQKNSWIPLGLAFGLPLILAVFAYTLAPVGEAPDGPKPEVAPPSDAYILLRVENSKGDPVAGQRLVILQKIEGGPYPTQMESTVPADVITDSAGLATVTLPKWGTIHVFLGDDKEPARIVNLHEQRGEQVEITLVSD